MSKIAVDLMGSDLGYSELSKAVIQFINEDKNSSFILFGEEDKIQPLFADVDSKRFKIVNTTEVIPMEIKPLDFLRANRSSMYQAIKAVKEGEADAVVSAGSTGGFVVGSTILLRNIDGVTRAGLCTPFPTAIKNRPCVILDVGASNVNTGEDIYGFARMGRIYAEDITEIHNPSVYTLSNGSEEGKGPQEVVDAYELMKTRKLTGFKGNCEAREALDGNHDVIVTSGYVGNIFLKATEGTAGMMNGMIKKAFKRNIFSKIGYLFAKKGIKDMKETLDYRRFGGAILLGINGVAVKAHGNSNTYAFYNAIKVADSMVKHDIINKIKKEFSND
jgi:glycerol-3-phosphate acyltransferase PlsX